MDKAIKKTEKKTAAAKSPEAEKQTQVSYAGRGERIAALVAAKKTDNQILEIIRAEFPGSSKSPVLKTIASKKAKAASAKAAPKAAKATAAKPAKKAKAEKPEAPVTEEPKAPAIPPRPQPTQE